MGEIRYRLYVARLWWLSLPGRFCWWLAWRLPERVVYFAFMRLWAHATTGPWGDVGPDSVTWSQACDRWTKAHRIDCPAPEESEARE